ncbi:nicotinate (nicotinamide) nucleotide adenylyltransferase [Salinicoccus hispanicus]|uniref:Probable nicotinate-nucleotide adenylyltransferase n=1 Tax=Salinicoccus hispanicus TaxID=157225 RepID=A0A6N8TVX0_9STAP|nr:nicotinate (nicotinamide) nucleotide adenylyltransferase [Salinicoccus hispanicus]MXQ50068.1 nicotinate (nicotinamide) nucleotide adenylyltransferase [Salinicoccus hispanicus]
MKIGLFGGTFDPVHPGHIHAVAEAYIALDLDKVICIPARQAPLKTEAPTSDHHRLKMLEYAVRHYDFIEIDTWEMSQEGVSYTYDTAVHLKAQYPDDTLYFLIGTDQYRSFEKWHRYQELLEMLNFVVMDRYSDAPVSDDRFMSISQPVLEISSTVIRDRLRKGIDVRHQLDPDVYQYIKENHLYEA